jgi:hypothetical protein
VVTGSVVTGFAAGCVAAPVASRMAGTLTAGPVLDAAPVLVDCAEVAQPCDINALTNSRTGQLLTNIGLLLSRYMGIGNTLGAMSMT